MRPPLGKTFVSRAEALARLKTSLQRSIGSFREPAEPAEAAPDYGWLRAGSYHWRDLLLFGEGASFVIALLDGSRFVGELQSYDEDRLVLKLWGCGGATTRFPMHEVSGAAIVGSHTFQQARDACARQRRGEPAHRGASSLDASQRKFPPKKAEPDA